MISLKVWDRPLSWHAKRSLPVSVRDSKTSLAKALQYHQLTGKSKIRKINTSGLWKMFNVPVHSFTSVVIVDYGGRHLKKKKNNNNNKQKGKKKGRHVRRHDTPGGS